MLGKFRSMLIVLFWAASVATFFTLPSIIRAQAVAIAQVSGNVTDPTGAAIVGAQVQMIETEKQAVHTAVTDAKGQYVLPGLPVGPYRLEVHTPGFKDYAQTGIVLQVNNNIQINAAMQVGEVTEKVEVSATASMVEIKENSISAVIDQKSINDLPLNGRQATQLIMSLGAATYGDAGDTGSKTFYSSTRISVAGGQGNGTAYLLDGGDNTDAMSNVNLPFPFPDALQEFSVETSAVSSRFGTHPGATVNVVTKSGANSFHGDLFEYLRNGDLNARNFFATSRDSLKRNQFGGTIGGRIIKDKLFFFGGYQGTINRSNPPTTTTYIPTPAMLQGNFNVPAGCPNAGNVIYNSLANNTPFPNNQIPLGMINPVAKNLSTQFLPLGAADQCGKVTFGIPITGDENDYISRIDWNQSAKNAVFGRYFVVGYTNPATFDGKNALTTTQAGNVEMAQSLTIGDNYSFGPATLNSFHATFNRRRDDRGPTATPINWTALGSNIYSAVPNFLYSSVTGGFSTFCGTCAPGHFNVNAFQVADDVDIIRGRHQWSFGFNLERVQNNTISGYEQNGYFTFNGSRTSASKSGAGSPLADFVLGLPNDFQQTNATPNDLRSWIMSFYVQDSFKVSSRILLNVGLRWEPTFPDVDKYGRGTSFSLAGFYANQHSTVIPNAPAGLFFKGDPGIPDAMWNGKMTNFAPRLGLVWNPHGDGRDTFRVGGAILYDATETWFNERETTNPPVGGFTDIPNPVGGLSNPWQGFPGGNPFPQNGSSFFPGGTYINMPINPKPTYVANWNATYQRQIKTWLASVSYLGNKTTHLWSTGGEINPAVYGPGATVGNTNQRRLLYLANPVQGAYYAGINTADDGAVAHYNGLLTSLQHRFGSSFTFNANYTYSSCLSDADFGAALASPTNSQPFNRHADWGRCVFDTRHNFNLSLVATSSVKRYGGWTNRLLNNWQLAPLFHAASGQPINIIDGSDNSLTGINSGLNDRPNQVLSDVYATNSVCNAGSTPCVQYLNKAAFALAPLGTFGNLSRNAINGPDNINLDVALSRQFKITERFSLQVRADAFNILNHTNFAGAISPAGTVSSYPTFSSGTNNNRLNAGTFGRIPSAFDPRIMQFALKLFF